MEIVDVVRKLVGPIDPVGETNADDERFENLKALAELVDRLVCDIDAVAMKKDRPEYSVSRAGKYAQKFFDDNLGIVE